MASGSIVDTSSIEKTEISLKDQMHRSQRLKKLKALLLIAPLFLFTLSVFVVPVMLILMRSVENPDLQNAWPQTVSAIQQWSAEDLPDESMYSILAHEIKQSHKDRTLSDVSKRLNYELSGMRSLISRTSRKLAQSDLSTPEKAMQQLLSIDSRWGEVDTWNAIKRSSPTITSHYLLSAVDHRLNDESEIVAVQKYQAIYVDILLRTLWIALVVTLGCLVLGFPLAHLMANAPPKWTGWLMIGLLLPFWTSLLVRTSAWMVLLQTNGVLNTLFINTGIISEPLNLLYERSAVYIALIHLLLPFMVLSLYSVMRSISPAYMRAALSLGAHPVIAFFRIYLPQTLPGVAAGGLLCFILALGYYITPALVGGAGDQMISYFIAYYTNQTVNWGMASALGVILFVVTGLLFLVYIRLSNGANLNKR
ncbi:ABC transporter permease [Marinobacter sp. KMM 10035]|uniref:ABC transporter permease n=1 Tax=Marinobacter sp. KMM 10035 TaxID=3134034 RepID=UPI00397E03C2